MARRTDAVRTLTAAIAGGLVTGLVLFAAGGLVGIGPATAGGARGDEVRAVYRSASPAVVSVVASDRTGSGFLVDDAGHVVTNAHVVGDDTAVEVAIGGRRVGAWFMGESGW